MGGKKSKKIKKQKPEEKVEKEEELASTKKERIEKLHIETKKKCCQSLRDQIKKPHIIAIVALCVIIAASCVAYFLIFCQKKSEEMVPVQVSQEVNANVALEEPKQLPRSIDGIMVDKGKESPYVYAIMIENMATSLVRPQSGLSSMPIVYETLAEGGITRFLGIYALGDAKQIGPVRSARPYYVEIAGEYQALYDHAGGSPQALSEIKQYGINDFNALGNGARYHWRDRSKSAPHNLYTSDEKLRFALRDLKFDDKATTFESWKFKDEAPSESRGENEKNIRIHFSSISYQSRFTYNKENNDYKHFFGDAENKDKNTGNQISVKNVIVQRVPKERSGGEKARILLNLEGEGDAYIFRDGQVVEGRWKKENRTARTKWYDKDGKEVELNRGNTWVAILPGDRKLEY